MTADGVGRMVRLVEEVCRPPCRPLRSPGFSSEGSSIFGCDIFEEHSRKPVLELNNPENVLSEPNIPGPVLVEIIIPLSSSLIISIS